MSKPRNAASFHIKKALKNSNPGVYELEENGVMYELTFEQFNLLKAARNNTIEEWYNKLDRFKKKEIKRSGNIKVEDNGFYPDIDS